MSLTRKALVAMGIEAEKIDQIIEMHSETVNALKNERDEAKAGADKYEETAKKLADTEKELSDMKVKADKPDAYKEKYEQLKTEYENYKSDIVSKETKAKKSKAYRDILKEIGVSDKRMDAVMRIADYDSIEFEEDGKVKGVDELKAKAKDEWSDYIVTEGIGGAATPTPPANTGGTSNQTSDAAKRALAYRNERYGTANKEE